MKFIFTIALQVLILPLVFSQGEPLPYSTGFDNTAEQAGWQEFRTGFLSTYNWTYGGPGFSAPSCISHDYNVGGNANDTVVDWFVSPPLNITDMSAVYMKVQTGGFSTPTDDNCEIWFGSDDPNPATGNFVLIGNISHMQPQYTWLDTAFVLPYTTDSGYIAIKYKTIGAAWMTYKVDNIEVDLFMGIDENNDRDVVTVYPTPFSTTATLQFGRPVDNATLTIYNAFGQAVKEVPGISGRSVVVDRDQLPAGLYVYRLCENENMIIMDKLIVAD